MDSPADYKLSRFEFLLRKSLYNIYFLFHFYSPLPLRELVLQFMAKHSLFLKELNRDKQNKQRRHFLVEIFFDDVMKYFFWKSWTQIQNRDKQIYKKHKNQIKMLNIIKFICKPLFKLNYSCLYFNKGLEKQTWILLTQQKMTKFFLKCTFWFPNALCPVHFYEWSNCTRSCKMSKTLFQISLLLFSTWREYFYSQPTHFSNQPKK